MSYWHTWLGNNKKWYHCFHLFFLTMHSFILSVRQTKQWKKEIIKQLVIQMIINEFIHQSWEISKTKNLHTSSINFLLLEFVNFKGFVSPCFISRQLLLPNRCAKHRCWRVVTRWQLQHECCITIISVFSITKIWQWVPLTSPRCGAFSKTENWQYKIIK